jgi:short-subunit dehydrogenase
MTPQKDGSGARRALVTGASAGIGEGFAHHLARRGYEVVLVARRRDRLEALAARLPTGATSILAADLATEPGVAAVEARLRAGDVDLLVNNAGFGTLGDFWSLPLARELEELDVNVRALMRLTHAALGTMVPRRRGAIINVASTAAFQSIPHEATYAATKAFVLHFSEAVHDEVAPHGVTVTTLCPGPVKTEFMDVAGIDVDQVPSLAWQTVDQVVEAALDSMAAGRAFVIPGTVNRVGAATPRFVPRAIARRIAGSLIQRASRR